MAVYFFIFSRFFLVKEISLFPAHRNHKEVGILPEATIKAVKSVKVHTYVVIRDAQHLLMSILLKVFPDLSAAVKVIYGHVADAALLLHKAVVNNEGNSYVIPQVLVFILAKADYDKTVQVPH